MSDFSDLLSKYIQEKNIQVASMVKYCGIDRSAMYKIIKGKHHPPTVHNNETAHGVKKKYMGCPEEKWVFPVQSLC